jgi:hypothetical protein
MRTRWAAIAATVPTLGLLLGAVLSTPAQRPVQAQAPTAQYGSEDDYGYGNLTPEQREGQRPQLSVRHNLPAGF